MNELAARLEQLLAEIDELEDSARSRVYELLDGIDALHRTALRQLEDRLGTERLQELRDDEAIAWLLDAYSVGIDERAAAEEALVELRPFIHSHGGSVEILDVEDGVVHLFLAGACAGCTASAITLKEGIERALAERLPGYRRIEVEEDDAAPHPPPGPTLVELTRFPAR
jgi:Fe-S cluster biogenesis protein NfuA